MDQTQLSLGPHASILSQKTRSLSSESDGNVRRKRKQICHEISSPSSIELQLNDPLPLDWEQCLDLQSGRMYYLDRKTLKKSWTRPKEHELDLDLNISSFTSSETKKQPNSCGSMVAVVCINCHLLVMLCESSPSCPNCKFVHSPLPSAMLQATPQKLKAVKPLETLHLLH
ncbi:hypothetical protein BHE74_00020172 [Ensete ventricosum]|uniref:Uncharacterized protein n=1 Tax=Ensete ventricosum TaxID=4639 RepID=A0A427ANX1_ENSVE|nr:hypothetical protein B296_00000447 [Ensete ventricosum]RWW26595.1 hypothetical protein GW17_00009010 [Ensete ventricosum]RWW72046.1 hypothetical protein BHE74_00020172 [Ensete ventricosum]RZR84329.1 hypothetical protein BHM03_00011126 [Ensete ventricosum]